MKRHVIIAPHADDEIVGCFSVLMSREVKSVWFPDRIIVQEATESSFIYDYSREVIPADYGEVIKIFFNLANEILHSNGLMFFPDPVYEWHPDHVQWGNVGVSLFRMGFTNIVFYSVNMTAQYISKTKFAEDKKNALNNCYPEKSDLWKYDHKYFLFEGYNKWLQPNPTDLCHD